MTIPDAAVDECLRDHDHRDHDCQFCDVRATWQKCNGCDARWEEGDQVTGPTDHEHVMCDDWWTEVLCGYMERHESPDGKRHFDARCGDQVQAGRDQCAFHARITDAEEAGRLYQRLVAVTR